MTTDSSLLCCERGCSNRWTSNFGRRLCAVHAPQCRDSKAPTQSTIPMPMPLPMREALPAFNELAERDDEEYVHDDRA